MLSGSALLRVLLTLVAAALLAALWQALPPLSGGSSAPSAPAVRRAEPTAPAPQAGVRTVGPPVPAAPPRPAPLEPSAPAPAVPEPALPAASAPAPQPAATAPAPPPPPAPDPAAVAEPSSDGATALRQGTPAAADDRPVAVDLLDLNTASVQELNRLRGGGLIGRAILRGRPYASVDDLLTKRVLSRSVYERIRDQVTVRQP